MFFPINNKWEILDLKSNSSIVKVAPLTGEILNSDFLAKYHVWYTAHYSDSTEF